MNEVDVKNPGEPLRSTREKLGLSISDVSMATKINPRILKALEEGQKEGLPPGSFTRGFIRSYAAYLKIDAKPILDAYSFVPSPALPETELKSGTSSEEKNANNSNTVAVTKNSGPTIAGPSEVKLKANSSSGVFKDSSMMSRVFIFVGILLLVGVVIGIKNVVDRYAQERALPPAPMVTDSEGSGADATDTEPKSADANAQGANPAATPEAAPANAAAPATPTSAAKEGETKSTETSIIEAKLPAVAPTDDKKTAEATVATKANTTPTTAAPATAVAPAAKPSATEIPAAPANPQEVIVEALDKVEIRVSIDGGPMKSIQLSPEGVHTIRSKSKVELEVVDGGMVNIIHNGREKGVPGDLGKSIKLKYP